MFVLVVFSINLWEIFSLFSVKVSYIALLGRFAFNMHYFYPNILEKGYVNAKRGKWIWEYWQADNKKVARGFVHAASPRHGQRWRFLSAPTSASVQARGRKPHTECWGRGGKPPHSVKPITRKTLLL